MDPVIVPALLPEGFLELLVHRHGAVEHLAGHRLLFADLHLALERIDRSNYVDDLYEFLRKVLADVLAPALMRVFGDDAQRQHCLAIATLTLFKT